MSETPSYQTTFINNKFPNIEIHRYTFHVPRKDDLIFLDNQTYVVRNIAYAIAEESARTIVYVDPHEEKEEPKPEENPSLLAEPVQLNPAKMYTVTTIRPDKGSSSHESKGRMILKPGQMVAFEFSNYVVDKVDTTRAEEGFVTVILDHAEPDQKVRSDFLPPFGSNMPLTRKESFQTFGYPNDLVTPPSVQDVSQQDHDKIDELRCIITTLEEDLKVKNKLIEDQKKHISTLETLINVQQQLIEELRKTTKLLSS